MATLKTSYMGFELSSPIIVGACDLSLSTDRLKEIQDAGAGAVIFKSLFEEQIQLESYQMEEELHEYSDRHAEMLSQFPSMEHAGPKEHLTAVAKARQVLNIPLIASLNALFQETWLEYARLLEETGVDGLELNFYAVPKDAGSDSNAIEKRQIELLKAVKSEVKIPVSVKLSAYYTNPLHFISKLDEADVDGVVVFNRFYQQEIDVELEKHVPNFSFSRAEENKLPMQFAGLLYGTVGCSIAANSGIHSSADVIKMILAGADVVQMVSSIYRNQISYITQLNNELAIWMDRKNYNTLEDFRGKLSRKHTVDPFTYRRAQYIETIIRSQEILTRQSLP